MTKAEIQALIASKIEGQGTNVDAGSVLPAILNGILDLIPASGGSSPIVLEIDETFENLSLEDALTHILVDGEPLQSYSELQHALQIGSIIRTNNDNQEYLICSKFDNGHGILYAEGGVYVTNSFGNACSLSFTISGQTCSFTIEEL